MWRSSVARLVWVQEVAGAKPATPNGYSHDVKLKIKTQDEMIREEAKLLRRLVRRHKTRPRSSVVERLLGTQKVVGATST